MGSVSTSGPRLEALQLHTALIKAVNLPRFKAVCSFETNLVMPTGATRQVVPCRAGTG
jgi:hypothetical protein